MSRYPPLLEEEEEGEGAEGELEAMDEGEGRTVLTDEEEAEDVVAPEEAEVDVVGEESAVKAAWSVGSTTVSGLSGVRSWLGAVRPAEDVPEGGVPWPMNEEPGAAVAAPLTPGPVLRPLWPGPMLRPMPGPPGPPMPSMRCRWRISALICEEPPPAPGPGPPREGGPPPEGDEEEEGEGAAAAVGVADDDGFEEAAPAAAVSGVCGAGVVGVAVPSAAPVASGAKLRSPESCLCIRTFALR